jgi:hypothetical protein
VEGDGVVEIAIGELAEMPRALDDVQRRSARRGGASKIDPQLPELRHPRIGQPGLVHTVVIQIDDQRGDRRCDVEQLMRRHAVDVDVLDEAPLDPVVPEPREPGVAMRLEEVFREVAQRAAMRAIAGLERIPEPITERAAGGPASEARARRAETRELALQGDQLAARIADGLQRIREHEARLVGVELLDDGAVEGLPVGHLSSLGVRSRGGLGALGPTRFMCGPRPGSRETSRAARARGSSPAHH